MLHSRSAIDPDIGPYIDPDGECVSAEKKSEVEMEVRDNGSVFWDDQISGIADPMLFLVGLKEAYENGKDHAWIGKIQDDGLQIAVNSFSDIQIRIAELIVFEDKNPAAAMASKTCSISWMSAASSKISVSVFGYR